MSTNSTSSLDEHELALEEAIEEASHDEKTPCSPVPPVPGQTFTRANLKDFPPAATILFGGRHSNEVENDELIKEERAVQDQVMSGVVNFIMLISLAVVLEFNLRRPAESLILSVYHCRPHPDDMIRCDFYEMNSSYRVDSFSWAYLGLHLFENIACSVVVPTQYKRMLQSRSNPLRDVLSACSFSLLHVQLAIIVGYIDPRMFCMFIVLTFVCFAFNVMAEKANQHGYGHPVAMVCWSVMIWLAQWVLLFIGLNTVAGHEDGMDALIVAGVLLFAFEIWYIWVAYFSHLTQCQRERRILIAGCMIRTLMAWTVAMTLPEPTDA